MKILFLIFLLPAVLAAGGCAAGRASAKIKIAAAKVGITFPAVDNLATTYATRVVVWNNTEDQMVAQVFIGGKRVAVLHVGEAWRGYVYFRQGVVIEAQVCQIQTVQNTTYFLTPPEWTRDAVLLGDAAISDEELDQLRLEPNKRIAETHVKAIRSALENRKILGRKVLRKELDRWWKAVKEYGVLYRDVTCPDPITVGYGFYLYYPQYGSQLSLYVRGSKQSGYWIAEVWSGGWDGWE